MIKMKDLRMKPQTHAMKRGFTLVELSIVLVIIGLIIGGVLTGQQIMQNARITNVVNGIQAFQAQFQTYTQNFGALPGDDSSATSRFPAGTNIVNGNNNGKVGTATSYNTRSTDGESAESFNIWAHMRAADLIKNQSSAGQPTNPFGGIYGFQAGAFNGTFTTTTLCLDEVSGMAAQTIDTKLDDGSSDTGTVRGALMGNVNTSPVTNYSSNNAYVLCVRM